MTQQPAAPKTILVVDDEATIRNFVSTLLSLKAYNVLTAGDGDEALQVSKDFKDTIDLLISNIQMPGITGIELAAKISGQRPDIHVMLMSGFEGGMLVLNEGWHFLHKPFVPSQLLGIVTTVLAQPPVPGLDEHK